MGLFLLVLLLRIACTLGFIIKRKRTIKQWNQTLYRLVADAFLAKLTQLAWVGV